MCAILFVVIVILASCDISLSFSHSSSVSSISRRRITHLQSQKVEDNDEGKVKDNDWSVVTYLVPVILSIQIFNSFQTSQQFSAIQEVMVKQVDQGTAMKVLMDTQKDQGDELKKLSSIQKDQGDEMKKLTSSVLVIQKDQGDYMKKLENIDTKFNVIFGGTAFVIAAFSGFSQIVDVIDSFNSLLVRLMKESEVKKKNDELRKRTSDRIKLQEQKKFEEKVKIELKKIKSIEAKQKN